MGLWSSIASRMRALVAAPPAIGPTSGGRGWVPVIREPYTGAWQQNAEATGETVVGNPTVFACTQRIATDVGKLRLGLVAEDDDGIWHPTTSAAFSPVLRKPNRYQRINKFLEQWIASKLLWGNTYVLKERDARGVVVALYVLDPSRVVPLVTPGGDVYYELRRDDLATLGPERLEAERLVVPAREIIHDLMVPLFHPLVGVSPIFACAASALEGLTIQAASSSFFDNRANPGGVILVPGDISQAQADAMLAAWHDKHTGPNAGGVALLTNGMKFEAVGMTAVDAELVKQLQWSAGTICSCFMVPSYLIEPGVHALPASTAEPLLQLYYSQCLQTHIVSLETALDEGLELPAPYGTELDIDDLIWMDTTTRATAARDAIGSAAMAPNEARKKYFGLGPVAGGDAPYMQQQNYSLEALAARDTSIGAPPSPPIAAAPALEDALDVPAIVAALETKAAAILTGSDRVAA